MLGADPSASEAEIRAAFRRMAAQYHPDRNPNDPHAATMFKRINAAYQVLSDASKRAVYDSFTNPIDDEPPQPGPSTSKQKKRTKPQRKSQRRAKPAATPPPTTSEREILRDARVVVTDQRILLPGREYLFSELRGVQFVQHTRNHLVPIAIVVTFVVVGLLWTDPSYRGQWVWFVFLGLCARFLLYLLFTPTFIVRLWTEHAVRIDAARATNAAWSADVVRAVDAGISKTNPKRYLGRLPAVPYFSMEARAGRAFGACVGLLVVAALLGPLFDPSSTSDATVDSSSSATNSTKPK